MFGFVGTVLFGAVLVGWIGVSIGFAVRHYGRGYGARSFIDPGKYLG